MVSALLVDTLKDPTGSLLELFDTCASVDEFPSLVSRHFSEIFKKVDAFQEVFYTVYYGLPVSDLNLYTRYLG